MSSAVTRIRPPGNRPRLGLRELLGARDLVLLLTLRDLRARYRQTLLGAAWVFVQPLVGALVFSFAFSRVAHLPSDGVSPVLFGLAGMVAWNVLATGTVRIGGSVLANAALVTKVPMPRLALPVAAALGALADLVAGLVVLGAGLVVAGRAPGPALLTLPLWVVLLGLLALGLGLLAAAASVAFRDVQQILPIGAQLALFASPVAYAASAVPESAQALYRANPAVGLLEGFRWAVLSTPAPGPGAVAWSAACAVVAALAGIAAFRRAEPGFADLL